MRIRALARCSMLAFTMTMAAVVVLGRPAPAAAAILTVTLCADPSIIVLPNVTLRSAIGSATAGDTIVVPPCLITLGLGELLINKNLTILGAGAAQTIIAGGAAARVLSIAAPSYVTIAGITIRNGTALPGSVGGGISNLGTLTLSGVAVTNNTAVTGGGIFNAGTLTILNSSFSANSTTLDGGAIDNRGPLTLINSTISGNTAQRSGGALVANLGHVVNIVNSTLAGNAAGDAGGIEVSSSPVTLKNTIVANNSVTNCRDFFGGITNVMSAGHNLQSDGSCSLTQPTDLSNTNPILGPLQLNGGSTPTRALLAGSPAIDAGDGTCLSTDQRGVPRPLDGNGDGTAQCDIGAYEARLPLVATGAGPGGGPHVRVFNAATGQEVVGLFPYPPGFTGGARVAMGDVNGDGVADLITGAGPGGGPHVQVFDGAALLRGQLVTLYSFFAYPIGFTGGVFVAAADLNGDGKADIITGAGPGGGPHVQVFDGATGANLASPVGSFFPYNPAFTGGVFVGGAP